jgi:polysaccharide deacetylase family protein (PEP-CTERM system associated)
MSEHTELLNGFSVDLEDWFQGLTSTNKRPELWPGLESRVVEATRELLAILRAHNVLATFFTLGHVADHHPQLVEEVAAAGHEIAVHGYWHRFVSRMTRDEFAAELDLGMEALARVTGKWPSGHRAPYFSINGTTPWAFEVLQSRGIRYDSSVFPTRNMLYGFPGAPRFPYQVPGVDLLEFPATTARFGGRDWPVAGGFYVRALPFEFVSRGVRQVNQLGQPAILYVHPWELDTGQRYKQVTFRERITHYYGRGGLQAKLENLFSEFRFGPLRDLPVSQATADPVDLGTTVVTV